MASEDHIKLSMVMVYLESYIVSLNLELIVLILKHQRI